jgi:hypothetical protein
MLFQILAVAFASLSALALIFSRQIRMLFARVSRGARNLLGIRHRRPKGSDAPSPDSHPASETAKALSTDDAETKD